MEKYINCCWLVLKIENNWGEFIKIVEVWKWEFFNLVYKEEIWNENLWMYEWTNEWMNDLRGV